MEREESEEHIIGASFLGILSALAMHFRHRKSKNSKDGHVNNFLAPVLDRPESCRVGRVERFSIYVVRQMGFKEGEECHQLRELAQEYLKRSKGCKERIFEYFGEDEAGLGEKLVEELDTLIFSYFAFHWSQVPLMICQVLSVDVDQKKFKDAVMAATRKLRFEKISKDLKVTRMFSTLVEEMNIIRTVSNGDSKCTDVMVPVAHSDRSPVLLLMGGGMGAGKSTVLKQILKESFWSGAAKNAVVVEADGFKETDVIYRALSSRGHHQDMLQIAELVHQSSTDAASSLLVTTLNEGHDVIMDGTLSWKPFVEETIAMARDVHRCRYRMGEGYKVAEDGTVIEKYWEEVEEEDEQEEGKIKRPYRIELVGVVCDAYLAIVRGIRRAIATGRAVRVKSQLKSHKRFASAFRSYCELVDNAKLYCTNDVDGPAKLIAWKDGENNLLVDQEEIRWLDSVKSLNDEAESIYELYPDPETICRPGPIWADRIMSSKRSGVQDELRDIIRKIENPVQNVNLSN